MPTAIEAKAGELTLRHQAILRLMEKKDADGAPDLTEDEFKDYQRYKQEATGLGDDLQRLRQMEEDAAASRKALEELGAVRRPGTFSGGIESGDRPAPGYPPANPVERLVKSIRDHPHFKDMVGASGNFRLTIPEVDIKATMTTATGYPPEVRRNGELVDFAARRPVVADLIPQTMTDQNAISYVEETTFTNAAAPVAEAGLKPESALGFTPRSVPVEWIATHIPATEQQLRTVGGIEAIIRNRLARFVGLAEEAQILNGTGTSPQLTGILTRTGLQTTAVAIAPDNRLLAVLRAINLIRTVAYREPSGIVAHPTDWTEILSMTDANGNFFFGGPTAAAPDNVWGIPVVPTTAMTLNTLLVGDFRTGCRIERQLGLTIEVGWMADDFARNIRRLRAEVALGLAVEAPAAFCTVTAA